MWNTQVWFPRFRHRLIDFPVTLPKGSRTLLVPFNREKAHPLHKKLDLLARKLSGMLQSWRDSNIKNIPSTSGNDCCFAVQGFWSIQSNSSTSFRFHDRPIWIRPGLQCYEHSQVCFLAGSTQPYRSSIWRTSKCKTVSQRGFSGKTHITKILSLGILLSCYRT